MKYEIKEQHQGYFVYLIDVEGASVEIEIMESNGEWGLDFSIFGSDRNYEEFAEWNNTVAALKKIFLFSLEVIKNKGGDKLSFIGSCERRQRVYGKLLKKYGLKFETVSDEDGSYFLIHV